MELVQPLSKYLGIYFHLAILSITAFGLFCQAPGVSMQCKHEELGGGVDGPFIRKAETFPEA